MKLAVVRIRGRRKISPKINKTLELLLLNKPNTCILVEDSPQILGMISVIKDYVTFGPVEEGLLFDLIYKRGKKGRKLLRTMVSKEEIEKAAKDIFSGKDVSEYANSVFRLKPPSKGFKNVKLNYPRGDLGKRPDIGPLLKRMM